MKIKTKRGARRTRNQRVITRRFVTTRYDGCSYITAGHKYPVLNNVDGILTLKDVRGDDILTQMCCSFHLDRKGRWEWGVI